MNGEEEEEERREGRLGCTNKSSLHMRGEPRAEETMKPSRGQTQQRARLEGWVEWVCWRPKPSVRGADVEVASDPGRKEKFTVLFLYYSSPSQCPP